MRGIERGEYVGGYVDRGELVGIHDTGINTGCGVRGRVMGEG